MCVVGNQFIKKFINIIHNSRKPVWNLQLYIYISWRKKNNINDWKVLGRIKEYHPNNNFYFELFQKTDFCQVLIKLCNFKIKYEKVLHYIKSKK
jgi:hypothetical protein